MFLDGLGRQSLAWPPVLPRFPLIPSISEPCQSISLTTTTTLTRLTTLLIPFSIHSKPYMTLTLTWLFKKPSLTQDIWCASIHLEYNSLIKNNTWELTALTPNQHALFSQWVVHIKPDLNPTHTQLKTRLVAKGYEQKLGIDYTETFELILKWVIVRIVVAIIATFGWHIYHLDVITAFLNGKLH